MAPEEVIRGILVDPSLLIHSDEVCDAADEVWQAIADLPEDLREDLKLTCMAAADREHTLLVTDLIIFDNTKALHSAKAQITYWGQECALAADTIKELQSKIEEIETMSNRTYTPERKPLPVRIISNMIAVPVAIVTSPVWLPISIYFENRRNRMNPNR